MTRDDKRLLRSDLFRHLDGIATAPIAYTLYQRGLLEALLFQKSVSIRQLSIDFSGNEGYLNVAFRILAAQGWCEYGVEKDQVIIKINEKSEIAFAHIPLYKDVVDLMQFSGNFHPRKFETEPFLHLERLFEKYQLKITDGFSDDAVINEIEHQIWKHIEGYIVGPSAVALGMGGMFHKYFMEASFKPEEFHQDGKSFDRMLSMFSKLGWFTQKGDTYSFTDKGLFFARRATAYGVTISYIPMFRQMDELLFGKADKLWDIPKGSDEIHVDRKMNVWGSGGSHSSYFKRMDDIIIDIFNRPIEEQPKGIVDMGCGNGAFLIHLFEVIEQRTLRGNMLDDYPLFLVGADFNEAALKVTKANIIQADIWAKIIFGDIGNPTRLADDLKTNYNIELKDLLNVRTFLDHNRIWEEPLSVDENRVSSSTGAFAFRGQYLSNEKVEENLLVHFNKWAPYIEKYGLLMIELHTIKPSITSLNIGKTPTTAYEATHGFSDQYIVEIDVLHKIAAEAGLVSNKNYFSKFPDNEMATVSINLFQSKK